MAGCPSSQPSPARRVAPQIGLSLARPALVATSTASTHRTSIRARLKARAVAPPGWADHSRGADFSRTSEMRLR
jgi:hypothetical protein